METLDQTTDDVPDVDSNPAASMEVGGSSGSGGLPTKEDLSEFDEVARTSTGDPGVSVEGYVITPDGEYFDPDSQETLQTLEAWKAQRRSSRHRVVRASATDSTDPVQVASRNPKNGIPTTMARTRSRREGQSPLTKHSPGPTSLYFITSPLERKISSRSWPATQTRRGTRTR